jgi:undecaprenyl-diphosphatase
MGTTHTSLLEPAPDARPDAVFPQHPVGAALAIVVAGYVALVALTLGIGLLVMHPLDGSVGAWDRDVSEYFSRHRTDALNDITKRATSGVGSIVRTRHASLPTIIVGGGVVAVLARRGRWREGAVLTIGLALELTVFTVVKFLVARPRPEVFDLSSVPSNTSFPSGHTAAATVLFAGIALIVICSSRNRVARAMSVLVATGVVGMVGFGRVYRGTHYLVDCIAGVLLGLGCLAVAVAAVRAASVRAARRARAVDSAPSDRGEDPRVEVPLAAR